MDTGDTGDTGDIETARERLIAFLRSIQRPEAPIDDVDENESLVAAGLIDSLAVMQIVGWLEDTYDIDFADAGLDPGELRSVTSILGVIARHAA